MMRHTSLNRKSNACDAMLASPDLFVILSHPAVLEESLSEMHLENSYKSFLVSHDFVKLNFELQHPVP